MNPIKTAVSGSVMLLLSATSQADIYDMVESVNKTQQTVDSTSQAMGSVSQAVTAPKAGLSDLLVKQLGVSQTQATGGAGALFQMAKSRMKAEAFNQLSDAVPGMDGLLAAVPKQQAGGALGLASGLSSMMGGGSTVSSALSLVSAFKQLNLSEGMVTQFTPIVLDYVKQQAGPELTGLLRLALAAQ